MIFGTEHPVGEIVPASAIYECSACNNITAFKQGEKFYRCPDCPTYDPEAQWYRTNEVLHFVSKNLNTEFERVETYSVRMAEFIAEFAGNVWFVYFHVIWFTLWIWLNTGHTLLGIGEFDPYPFGFLTLVVSLEAIFLSTFILIAQNLQGKRSELRADLDYQTNLKTEKDVAEVLSILNDIRGGQLHLTKGGRIVLSDAPKKKPKRPR